MAAFKEKDMFFQGCKCNKSFCFKGSLEAERFCSADNWMWGIFPGENKSHFSIQNTVKSHWNVVLQNVYYSISYWLLYQLSSLTVLKWLIEGVWHWICLEYTCELPQLSVVQI